MEKMREEFELAWQVSRSDDEGNLGGKPTRSKIDGDRYAGDAAQFAWIWWKRSRESLCVELPEREVAGKFVNEFEYGHEMGFNDALSDCRIAIEKQGVSYK